MTQYADMPVYPCGMTADLGPAAQVRPEKRNR